MSNGSFDPIGNRDEPDGQTAVFTLGVLVAGVAIGAVAALLLAPKSGTDLRVKISSNAVDWKSRVLSTLEQGREAVIRTVESSRRHNPESDNDQS